MKKIVLTIGLLSVLLAGCSKEIDEIPEDILPTASPNLFGAIYERYGIRLSDKDSITFYGGIIDSTDYRMIVGRKNDNAWIAYRAILSVTRRRITGGLSDSVIK